MQLCIFLLILHVHATACQVRAESEVQPADDGRRRHGGVHFVSGIYLFPPNLTYRNEIKLGYSGVCDLCGVRG